MITRRRALALGFTMLVGLAVPIGANQLHGTDQLDATGYDGSAKVLIRDASMVLTMDPAVGQGTLGMLKDADVLMTKNTITAVGKDLPATAGARVIDGRGKIVMPGFVDLHTHTWQSLIRGCATDKELNGWLAECVLPLYGNQPAYAEGYAGTRLSTLDAIGTGITTTTDWSHSFSADFANGSLKALADSKMRFFFSYTANTNPATLDEIRRVKKQVIDPNPLAHLQVGQHPTLQNLPSTAAAENLAKELGVALNVHVNESKTDPATGQMEALRKVGAMRPGLLMNHAVQMTDAELDELAANDIRVAHNPLSNMRLASGVIRLPEMASRGIKVGLGIDGGTNDTTDMFNDMRAAVGLQRATAMDPTRYPQPADVLRMATLGGAEALGIEKEIGSLTPGKKADLQIIDPQALNFAPNGNWVSQLVFNAQPVNVQWVFVNGVAVKREGRLIGVDTAKVIRDADKASDRIDVLLGR
ncbi:amidohydrolase family protein [Kribbella sp. NBC_01505]|uniref:amidohydrolase family protein n=1 Tax=Kribbella sp. NBC_01505 TaxID=2903580 RepID=UPI00386A55AF